MLLEDTTQSLLRLLQLVSPALPVGAFSYSEGLETLVHQGKVHNATTLQHWLTQELRYGAIRVEAAIASRIHHCITTDSLRDLPTWNHWVSAFREAEELREQSWQMGRSLSRLLRELEPTTAHLITACGEPCNFVVAFAIAAAHWRIDRRATVLGYLHSWASNLVNAGVRLIPLGQTAGQHLLLNLYLILEAAVDDCLQLQDDELECCSWGLAIACMTHETLYSRLFRS